MNINTLKKHLREAIIKYDKIDFEVAHKLAGLAVKTARKKFGVSLNYSLESVDMVEAIIKKKPKLFLRPVHTIEFIAGLGFYIGEVIIRNFGGSWGTDFMLPNRSDKEILSPLVIKRGDLYWSPVDKLISLIERENNQSLTEYINKIGQEINANKKIISEEDESIYRLLTDGFWTGLGPSFHKHEELIKKAERFILQKFFKKLSYSLDSAEKTEKIINKLKTLNLSSKKLAELIVGLGYYLAEIINRQYGKGWMGREYIYRFKGHVPFADLGKLEIFRDPVNVAIAAYKNGGTIIADYMREVKQVVERNKEIKEIRISNLTKEQSDRMLDFLLENSVRKFNFSIININDTPLINKLSDDLMDALRNHKTGFYYSFNQKTKEILKKYISKGILPDYFKRKNNFEDFTFFKDNKIFLEITTHEDDGFLYLTNEELKEFERLGIKYERFVEKTEELSEKKPWHKKIFRK